MAIPKERSPMGYQRISSLSSAVGLTVPSGATVAEVQAETVTVRWRDDGTNPTSSVGSIIPANETLTYTGDLDAIKFIEVSASAVLNVSYYR